MKIWVKKTTMIFKENNLNACMGIGSLKYKEEADEWVKKTCMYITDYAGIPKNGFIPVNSVSPEKGIHYYSDPFSYFLNRHVKPDIDFISRDYNHNFSDILDDAPSEVIMHGRKPKATISVVAENINGKLMVVLKFPSIAALCIKEYLFEFDSETCVGESSTSLPFRNIKNLKEG